MPIAILDADVLFPMILRDTLLRVAAAGAYRVHWSDRIIDEVVRNLIDQHLMEPAKASRLAEAMRNAFPEATVEDWESLEATMTNHPKDRHVAAAATKARADIIVTSNLKDFCSLPDGMVAMSPDDFLISLVDADREAVIGAIEKQAAGYRNPPATVASLLQWLGRVVPVFAKRVGSAISAEGTRS
jgi:predicted nucleic acid-binding protein